MKTINDLPKPTPALGLEYYENNFHRRLDYSFEAKANYDKFTNSNKRNLKPDYRPLKIDIEPVSRCNFACTMCVVSTWDKGKRSDDLTVEDFKTILTNEPQVTEIKLQGLGEPLMIGDSLFEMIRLARAEYIWMRTTTNASLLHRNNNIEKLIDSGICEIQVSIDGASENTLELIRKGSKAKRVFENCLKLNEFASSKNWNCTKMWTVVQKNNLLELENLVLKAYELGFKSQCFSVDLHGWGIDQWQVINQNNSVETLSFERLNNLISLGQAHGIKVEFWQNSTKYSRSDKSKLCPWPFERTMISSDLRVTPCCMISNPDTLEIGKQYSESNWTSREYQEFRNSHLTGKIPPQCEMCYEKN
jgi:pyrroloquinoline quinone biosynthesis protein E